MRTPTTGARPDRSAGGPAARCGSTPNVGTRRRGLEDPEAALARRLEIGRLAGVGEAALARAAERARGSRSGVAEIVEPDRHLLDGVIVDTDLGPWEVYETPGHAPSHVCLLQRERRLLISGDHLLGRPSLYFDYGFTPDPVGEYLHSLDVIEPLDARLCLSGHGRTFTDVPGHITRPSRARRDETRGGARCARRGPEHRARARPQDLGEGLTPAFTTWRLTETICYLRHLQQIGRAARDGDDAVEWWRATGEDRTQPQP